MLTELFKKNQEQQAQEQQQVEVPLVFVDVTLAQASTEAPKQAKYYSDKNSTAANPEPTPDSTVPKIDGKQTDIVKTEDVPRQKAVPLQPPVPDNKAEKAKEDQPEAKPKPAFTVGDLAMAKPEPVERKSEGQDESEEVRPRRLKDVPGRQPPESQFAGQKMKQDGGVSRRARIISLDVQGSPFGGYDAKLFAAIQNQWYALIDSRNYAGEQSGKVTIRFDLNYDGTISQTTELQTTVDSVLTLLCRMAVEQPAPYEAWPADMRQKMGKSYREYTITFLYY